VARVQEELSSFGDLARVEVPPGQQAVAVASFYDIRAASSAKAALGGRCAEAPQHGDRTVLLRGDVQLHTWMVPEVSSISQSSDGCTYFLDFFDTRAAERAAIEFDARSIAVPEGPICEKRTSEETIEVLCGNGVAGTPKYRNDLRLSQVNWGDLASGREWRTTLRLQCLPKQLCDEEALKRVLSLAGLSKVVDCIRVFPGEGKRPGSAIINTVDTMGAAKVAKYMHGRQWGRSMPVSVSFAAVQGADEVQKSFPKAVARTQSIARKEKAAPWRVETFGPQRASEDNGVSEASTEAGDEIEIPISDAAHVEAASLGAGPRA